MKKKMLIVEDDLEMLNLYQCVLRDIFEIIPAINGEEAVGLAVSAVPDLILMDVMMPVMGGLEALKLIKENPAATTIPVILLSPWAIMRISGEATTWELVTISLSHLRQL